MSTAAAPGPRVGPGAEPRSFNAWRRERPFWGAVVCIAGAIELYSVTMAPLSVVVTQGLPGLATLFIAALSIVLACLTLAQPHLRSITGWMIIIMGIISVLVSNLGGFVVGMLLLVAGGSLLLSWEPPWRAEAPAPGGSAAATVPGAHRETVGATREQPAVARESSYGAPRNPVAGAGARPAGQRPPAKRRPPVKKRSGLGGVLDTMTGGTPARKPPPRKRPVGGAPARRPVERSTPLPTSGDGISSPSASPASPAPKQAAQAEAERRPRLSPPDEPPTHTFARTWILIPLIVGALSASAIGAAPATALGAGPRAEGPLDWLFPPAEPTPTPPAPAPTPSPTPDPGFTIPPLFPAPSPTASPAPSAPAAPAPSAPADPAAGDPAACDPEAYPNRLPAMGSAGALESAATVRDCAAAAAEAPVKVASAADGLPTVSNTITTLKASSLTMNGLSYDGVTQLTTNNGPLDVLKFSLDTLEVAGMDQTYPFAGGTVGIANTTGNAQINGDVGLYVTKMTGKVFGLVELTFTPTSPPPLIVPFLIMTDTTSEVALVQANEVKVPSLLSTVK